MTLSIGPIELVWIGLNLTTLVASIIAFYDAKADRTAVRLLNGHARELAASGIVRREFFRVLLQVILLALIVPSLFTPGDAQFGYFVGGMMTLALLLLFASFLDARDRKAMTVLITSDALTLRHDEYTELKAELQENTRISQEAVAGAEKAYHEANSVNEKIAALDEALVAQGVVQAEQRVATEEATAGLAEVVEDTHEKVTDLHAGTAPEPK